MRLNGYILSPGIPGYIYWPGIDAFWLPEGLAAVGQLLSALYHRIECPFSFSPELPALNSGIFCFLARQARKRMRRRRSRGTGKPSRPIPLSSLTNPFIYVQFPILVPLASHRDLMIDPQTSQQRRTVLHH